MRNRDRGWLAPTGGMALALAWAISSAPAPAAGQQPPSAPAAAPSTGQAGAAPAANPVLRLTTRLVQVSVVAHDGHGRPVGDLTQDDFRVFDNGQEVKVEFFEKEASGIRATAPEVATPGAPPIWSNREMRAGTPINLTVLLWDGLNTKPSDQSIGRKEIIKFLGNIHPEDRIALYALGDDLRVLHDFTSDASSLLAAMKKKGNYSGTNSPENEPPVTDQATTDDPDLDAFFAGQDAVFASYQTQDRVLRTTDALEAIAAHVAPLPGRKNLVWVSDSFPLQLSFMTGTVGNWEFSENIQRATRALNDANVAVYPVDPRGVTTNLAAVSTPGPRPGQRPSAGSLTPTIAGSQHTSTMEEFASLTGGVAYHDNNDISGAIRSAMDDSQLVYMLAYTPGHGEWNNEYRKIKVEVKRSGVHLRYRSGYLATPYTPLDARQKDHVLAEAQWSPIEAAEIGLKFQAQAGAMVAGKPGVRFAITADPAGLQFTDADGTHAADLALTLGQKAADGHLLYEETKTVNLRLKDENYKAVRAAGLKMLGSQAIDPAATEFRIVLLDLGTGRLGSVHVPVAKLGVTLPPTAVAAPAAPAKP